MVKTMILLCFNLDRIAKNIINTVYFTKVFISWYTMVFENNLLYRQHFRQHLLLLISLQLVNFHDVMLPHEEVFCLTKNKRKRLY